MKLLIVFFKADLLIIVVKFDSSRIEGLFLNLKNMI